MAGKESNQQERDACKTLQPGDTLGKIVKKIAASDWGGAEEREEPIRSGLDNVLFFFSFSLVFFNGTIQQAKDKDRKCQKRISLF